jgi:hypothetical protein
MNETTVIKNVCPPINAPKLQHPEDLLLVSEMCDIHSLKSVNITVKEVQFHGVKIPGVARTMRRHGGSPIISWAHLLPVRRAGSPESDTATTEWYAQCTAHAHEVLDCHRTQISDATCTR